jgi:biopolymer transport protein ExbD
LGIVRAMNTTYIRTAVALVTLGFVLNGCGSKEEAKVPAQPIVGVLELPVSLRTGGSQPTDVHKVEINLTELRVDETKSLKLDAGRIIATEKSGATVPKLDVALSAPARTRVAIEVHASVPYDTVVAVLDSARKAGIRNAAFMVRKPGGSASTGWLELNNFGVTTPTDEEVPFDNVAPRQWSDFVSVWEEMVRACHTARSGVCIEKPVKIANGGHVQVELFSAGVGVNIQLKRVGAPPPEVVQKQIEKEAGRKLKPEEKSPVLAGMPDDIVAKFDELPFAVEAGFQFRGNEAVTVPSPFSATMAPLCGKSACGVVIKGRADTVALWTIAMIGAAFPDGATAPQVVFIK